MQAATLGQCDESGFGEKTKCTSCISCQHRAHTLNYLGRLVNPEVHFYFFEMHLCSQLNSSWISHDQTSMQSARVQTPCTCLTSFVEVVCCLHFCISFICVITQLQKVWKCSFRCQSNMRSLPFDLIVPEYAPGTRYDSTVDDPANPKAKKTHGTTCALWFLSMRLSNICAVTCAEYLDPLILFHRVCRSFASSETFKPFHYTWQKLHRIDLAF